MFDFDKIFVCLFVANYPYKLRPFWCLLKDLVLVESMVMGGGYL